MLEAQVIGVGAAGNKAALELLKNGTVGDKNRIMLINSTPKDIPAEYADMFIQIGSNASLGGCGKEPDIGERICIDALKEGKLNLEEWVLPTTKIVIVVCSTEGGTGSGATPVIAKYLREVMGMNVHVFAFLGFEEDARGLLNTVNFFKRLPEDVTVEAIRNKNFLEGRNRNYITAEEMADKEFSIRISILLGNMIVPSSQNMDDTDLYKVATQTGYMNIEYRTIDDVVKNIDHFNEIVADMIENTKSLRPDDKTQKLLGVMINLPERSKDAIDYSCNEIINKYGKPFEKFTHVQSDNSVRSFIAFIIAGMDLPLDDVKGVYERYVQATSAVHKDKDSFFNSLTKLNEKEEDKEFNLENKTTTTQNRNSFFDSFGDFPKPEKKASPKAANGKKEDVLNNM